ncbi:MAG: hypothetical protein RDU25_05675 [Patescibacteria group bacterium]|nr:hypothetical protein [Patescibacteria group bacterium]
MLCIFCGRPNIDSAARFCDSCLHLLVIQRAIERGRFHGVKIMHLLQTAKRLPCLACAHKPCTCLCVVCHLTSDKCTCRAEAILAYYGIQGYEDVAPQAAIPAP